MRRRRSAEVADGGRRRRSGTVALRTEQSSRKRGATYGARADGTEAMKAVVGDDRRRRRVRGGRTSAGGRLLERESETGEREEKKTGEGVFGSGKDERREAG